MMIRVSSATIAIAAFLFAGAGVAQAATICVDPADASCEATIQAAVTAAAAGDTIEIAAGGYLEYVAIPSDEIRQVTRANASRSRFSRFRQSRERVHSK